jgi:hypothetical protein
MLGYQPAHSWQEAITMQLQEMNRAQKKAMKMARPIV